MNIKYLTENEWERFKQTLLDIQSNLQRDNVNSINNLEAAKSATERAVALQAKSVAENRISRLTRNRALFILMYWRGLRVSEPKKIRRSDIDLKTGTIELTRLKNSNGGRYQLQQEEYDALKAWLEDDKCHENHIFPISRAQIEALFKAYATEAGIPEDKRHPHVLKHSIATHLADKGLDVLDIQDWLGHRSVNSTMVYLQVTSKRRRLAAERIREIEKA